MKGELELGIVHSVELKPDLTHTVLGTMSSPSLIHLVMDIFKTMIIVHEKYSRHIDIITLNSLR